MGHPEDSSGLTYMQARYYDRSIGRFLSEDPAMDGINWYLYCSANPVNYVDFNGDERIRIFDDIGGNGQWIQLHSPGPGATGQKHIVYGDKKGKWGALNIDGSIHDKKSYKKGMTKKMKNYCGSQGSLKGFIASDSITASLENDPLGTIAIFLDMAGDFQTANELDEFNERLNNF